MSRFTKLQTLQKIVDTGIVPLFYHADVDTVCHVAQACYEGGIRVFEFTNRGDFALEVFKELVTYVHKHCPELAIGAGTVTEGSTAAQFIQYGADFIVGPYLNPELVRLCNRHLLPHIPGCGTLTEIGMAHELGCDMVKIFPAGSVGGPSFVKDAKAPFPHALIMATGSVEPEEDNLKAWAEAGVTCVGMGSKLITKENLSEGKWDKITELCKKSLSIFEKYAK